MERGLGYITSLKYTYPILETPEGEKMPHDVKAGRMTLGEYLSGNPCGPRTLDGATAEKLRSQS